MSVSVLGPASLALALGLRHGLDADHLAAIDGLTRFNMIRRRDFAPYCGALFSAGHGLVIVLASAVLAILASAWIAPSWLDLTGKIISAAILCWLGACNLMTTTPRQEAPGQFRLVGLRTDLFTRVLRSSHAWQILLIGAFFALSFDAFGLAILFAASAGTLGGTAAAAALATVFTVGMVIVDSSNGVWLARMACRSDQTGATAARRMTLGIALASLLLGIAIASSCVWSPVDQWLDEHQLGASLLLALAVSGIYLSGRVARQPGRPF